MWGAFALVDALGTSPRALALFRFALATVVALEVADRWPLLEALYTDDGALPRSVVMPEASGEGMLAWMVCVHAWQGSLLWVQALSCLQVTLAATLAVGVAPVTSSLLLWWLHCSCALRNASLVYILDRYLHVLLMLSAYLPTSMPPIGASRASGWGARPQPSAAACVLAAQVRNSLWWPLMALWLRLIVMTSLISSCSSIRMRDGARHSTRRARGRSGRQRRHSTLICGTRPPPCSPALSWAPPGCGWRASPRYECPLMTL